MRWRGREVEVAREKERERLQILFVAQSAWVEESECAKG